MATQVPPGKLASRVREIVSAPPQKAAPLAPSLRAPAREHGAPASVAPAVPFEFGAVQVQQPAGAAEGAVPAAAPKMEIKPKAAVPPAPKPTVPAARAEALPPAPVPATSRTPGETRAPQAAAPLAPPRLAAPVAAPVRPPMLHPESLEPSRRDPARVTTPSVAPWIRVFHGLRRVAEALLARTLASRSEDLPAPAARPGREKTPAGHARAMAESRGEVDALALAAQEIRRWATDAGTAAGAAAARPDAAAVAPFGPEAARIGQAARAVGAGLAAVRVARGLPRGESRARMLLRWTVLEQLLGRARAGDAGIGPPVSAGAAAASTEAEALASRAGARPLAETGAPLLFAAADGIDHALGEAAHNLAQVSPGKDETAALPVEAMLDKAAAVADAAGTEAPATALPPVPAVREVDGQRAPEPRVPPEKRTRPEKWELRIAATSTEVGVEDIARTLGIARIAELRDVLAEGLSTRHQFVLWTRVGTRLTAPLQALVNDGLIETRIQPRG